MKIVAILFFSAMCAFAKVSVSVSVIPQAFFVQKIAGNLAEVNIIVQKGKSPETYEPSIKELDRLSKSQVYFTIGMPFERALIERFESTNLKIIAPLQKGKLEAYLTEYGLDLADSHFHKDLGDFGSESNESNHYSHESKRESSADSRESKTKSSGESIIDSSLTSQDLRESSNKLPDLSLPNELQGESRSKKDERESHIHRHYPHILLSFKLSKAHAQVICDNLCAIDSKNCATYKRNLARFEKEIDKMFAHFKSVFRGKGVAFLVYHPAFSYLANELGLKEIAIEQDGKETKSAHTKEILKLIKKHKIKVIFIQPQFSSKNARAIAKEAKIAVKTADPLAFDWLENMNAFLSELERM